MFGNKESYKNSEFFDSVLTSNNSATVPVTPKHNNNNNNSHVTTNNLAVEKEKHMADSMSRLDLDTTVTVSEVQLEQSHTLPSLSPSLGKELDASQVFYDEGKERKALLEVSSEEEIVAELDHSMFNGNLEQKSFAAKGDIDGCLTFYAEVYVHLNDSPPGFSFKGRAGGIVGLPLCPCADLSGKIFTDDVRLLLTSTSRFQLTTSPFWVSIVFFDSNNTSLGNFQAGTAGFLVGVSGGKGKWRKRKPRYKEKKDEKKKEKKNNEVKKSHSNNQL